MPDVRITVLKREFYQHLLEEHIPPDGKERDTVRCPVFEEGKAFVSEMGRYIPKGFCNWAWSDIYRDVVSVAFGVGHPWTHPRPMAISCCTDGKRPVVFKIEAIKEGA